MSKLEDLRDAYEKLGDRQMPEELRNRIHRMIQQHHEEDAAVATKQGRETSRSLKRRLVAPLVSGVAVVVALGVVTGVLVRSDKTIPALGGYQKSVAFNQLPEHVQLSIRAIESFDSSMKPNLITQLTETRKNVFSNPVYHIDLSGKFPIQQSLPHKTGETFPELQRLVLSIPADDSYVSLQGYTANKMVYQNQHLPVVNKQWTFSGSNSMWQATYTVDLSAVEFPQYDYAQMSKSQYELRYLGKDSSAIGHISYKFTFPNDGFASNSTKLPASGVISEGAGQGGGLGALMDYSGEHGTVTVNWKNQSAVVPLHLAKQGSGSGGK